MAAKKAAQSPRERRATKVLDAAQELFATRGYEATLVAEIAESASVAPATIYNYFSTKPNLLMSSPSVMFARRCPSAERSSKICLKTHFKASRPSSAAGGTGASALVARMLANNDGGADCRTAGRAARTGARLNDLIKRQYVQIIRTYQARGRLVADVDASTLSDLTVGVATMNFARFIYGPGGTIENLLRIGLPHIALILRGLLVDERSRPRRRTRME
jgi:hypothetical protein